MPFFSIPQLRKHKPKKLHKAAAHQRIGDVEELLFRNVKKQRQIKSTRLGYAPPKCRKYVSIWAC